MPLTPDQTAWLDELRAARRKLILGERVTNVASGGRSIALAGLVPEAALQAIDAEIERIEAGAAGDGRVRRRGALRFHY